MDHFIIADDSNKFSLMDDIMQAYHDEEISLLPLKKKKLASDERLKRSRERNRIHARKTRERKKLQMGMLESRVNELKSESQRLRQLVDERYTADLLVVLSTGSGNKVEVQSSATLCGTAAAQPASTEMSSEEVMASASKRSRRRGKYTPQERERIRRERNRMHAKKTRDKKKSQFDSNEQVIAELEKEMQVLRDYLVCMNIMTREEADRGDRHDKAAKAELALFKTADDAMSNEEDDSMSNDGGSNDGSGSQDGSNSQDGTNSHDGSGHNSNDDDSAGTTSAESGSSKNSGSSKTSSSDYKDSNKRSSQNSSDPTSSSASDNFERSESCGSGSGGDSPPPDGDDRTSDKGEGFVSNYGPSKQGRRQKRPKDSNDMEVEHPDVQSGLYGPSKQAYDAKAKSKMTMEYKGAHGFAPL